MVRIQDLKKQDTGERPATQRVSLAREHGPRDATARRLDEDTLVAWIRESMPPSDGGSQPIELPAAARRSASRPARQSGVHVVRKPSVWKARALRVWRAAELLVCVALWSVLLMWVLGTALRAPVVLAPLRDVAQGVAGLQQRAADESQALIGWLDGLLR